MEIKEKNIIANKFNDFFTDIGPKLADKIPSTNTTFQNFLKNPSTSSIGIELTSPAEVILVAKELRPTHSRGLDEIDPQIAKFTIEATSIPLAEVMNCSILTGTVPTSLKIAKIIPIFKGGDKQKICNYRPISILPYFSKFFEKIIYGRVMSYITSKNTNVFMSNKSIDALVSNMNNELKIIGEWFKANKLSLNLTKTNFILFCSKRKLNLNPGCNIAINIDNQCVARVSSTKFLGVHIDEHLTWKDHITYISKKISKI